MSSKSHIRPDDPAPRAGRILMFAAGGGAVALFAGALLLWRENGLTVYMERLASGIASCF